MKLIEYNNLKSRSSENTEPLIHVSKSGIITFNQQLINELKLVQKRKISFFQDEDSPKDWYIKLDTINGIPLKEKKNSSILYIQYKNLSDKILESLNSKNKSLKIRVSTQLHEGMYSLITRAL